MKEEKEAVKNDNYMYERMDMRRFFLCLASKVWIIVLATLICGMLGAGIYDFYYSVTDGQPKYQMCTDYYITFNEADHPNGMDYFNAYTWNQFVTDDRIVNLALKFGGVTSDEIKASVSSRMMSDYRVLTVVVTGTNPKRINAISEAYKFAMPLFADEVDEITKIEIWSQDNIEKINDHTLMMNAALLGALIGLVVSAAIWLVYYSMNDRIYTQSDWSRRFPDVAFLGYDCAVFGDDTLDVQIDNLIQDETVWPIAWGEHASSAEYKLNELKNKDLSVRGVVLTDCNEKFLKRYYGRTSK